MDRSVICFNLSGFLLGKLTIKNVDVSRHDVATVVILVIQRILKELYLIVILQILLLKLYVSWGQHGCRIVPGWNVTMLHHLCRVEGRLTRC